MPRQRLPIQYFADILDQLKGVNERLDQLIPQQAPAEVSEPAGGEPAPVRLEEPVRDRPNPAEDQYDEGDWPFQERGEGDWPFQERGEGIDVENDAQMSPIDQHGTCQEQTKRGNICGKPLPCRYHG